ncbi:MAG: hypothetical protein U0165_15475 [Polyangiaceae bacterium]
MRTPTTVELAAILAVGGSVLAVAIPTFLRNLRASHFSEAARGLQECFSLELGASWMEMAVDL